MKSYFVFILLITIVSLIGLANSSLQFELVADRARCYIEELYKGQVMMVKWKVSNLKESEPDEQAAKRFLYLIQYQVTRYSDHTLMMKDIFRDYKGKFSFKSNEDGLFKVCLTYLGGWTVPYPVLVGLKISSDNMDEPDIKNSIKSTDVDILHERAKKIIEKGKDIVYRQRLETDDEDLVANSQIQNTRYYYNMAVFQILTIAVVGIYQVYRFRKFLLNNNVI
jgi:hypothetical protein